MMARNRRPEHKAKRRKDRHHHKPAHKPGPAPDPGGDDDGTGTTATEKIKAQSHQTGQEAMNAAPSHNPAFDQAVYSTGPGEAVEYNYVRVDGGNEQYALQQSEYTAPVPRIAGFGQTLTPGAAMGTGAENNPT